MFNTRFRYLSGPPLSDFSGLGHGATFGDQSRDVRPCRDKSSLFQRLNMQANRDFIHGHLWLLENFASWTRMTPPDVTKCPKMSHFSKWRFCGPRHD
jgi:hypothetical protein